MHLHTDDPGAAAVAVLAVLTPFRVDGYPGPMSVELCSRSLAFVDPSGNTDVCVGTAGFDAVPMDALDGSLSLVTARHVFPARTRVVQTHSPRGTVINPHKSSVKRTRRQISA